MSRGRRLTAEQCLALLQQLDEENSSNDGSDNESNLEISDGNEIIEEQGSNSTDEDTDTDDPDTSNSTRTQRDAPAATNLRAPDGTEWKILNQDATTPGRIASQNVLKEKAGPTPYANRNIGENEASSWRLLFQNPC